MENLRVAFEPFIDDGVRRFIDDGISCYNIAITGLPAYFPTNFVLRSERGEVLGGTSCDDLGRMAQGRNAVGLGDRSRAATRLPNVGGTPRNVRARASALTLSAFRLGRSTNDTGTLSLRPTRTIRRDT